MTKAQLQQQLAERDSELARAMKAFGTLEAALHDMVCDTRLKVGSHWHAHGGRTIFHVSSTNSPRGTLFWETFHCRGQSPSTTVWRLDDLDHIDVSTPVETPYLYSLALAVEKARTLTQEARR